MFVPVAVALLMWVLAAKALLDGKIVWRFGWTWTRDDQPKAFWRFVILLMFGGLAVLILAYFLRDVPHRYR
jgi:H+/Cl- antiporter ClcA